MCVTENWLNTGESSMFSELLPADCSYFNTSRTSGRGGTAVVLKRILNVNHAFYSLLPALS